jgi:hypothetical protein
MAVSPQQELIWQGRTHLGDEPGVYGDAHYSGLCAELPITVFRSDPMSTEDTPFKIVLETENLETFRPFPGHAITVIIYEPDPTQQFHSVERVLADERFTSDDNNRKEVTVKVGTEPGPFRISVRLRIDTTVNPGFYDDFVWLRLSLISEGFKYFASFGFDNP